MQRKTIPLSQEGSVYTPQQQNCSNKMLKLKNNPTFYDLCFIMFRLKGCESNNSPNKVGDPNTTLNKITNPRRRTTFQLQYGSRALGINQIGDTRLEVSELEIISPFPLPPPLRGFPIAEEWEAGERERGRRRREGEADNNSPRVLCVLTHYVGAPEVKPIDLQFILTSVKSMRRGHEKPRVSTTSVKRFPDTLCNAG